MKMGRYRLVMPSDLVKALRQAAKKTGLSVPDVMRQSMKLGLPKLVEQFSVKQALGSLKPMSEAECRKCWEEPNAEFDKLEHHCADHPYQPLLRLKPLRSLNVQAVKERDTEKYLYAYIFRSQF